MYYYYYYYAIIIMIIIISYYYYYYIFFGRWAIFSLLTFYYLYGWHSNCGNT